MHVLLFSSNEKKASILCPIFVISNDNLVPYKLVLTKKKKKKSQHHSNSPQFCLQLVPINAACGLICIEVLINIR